MTWFRSKVNVCENGEFIRQWVYEICCKIIHAYTNTFRIDRKQQYQLSYVFKQIHEVD